MNKIKIGDLLQRRKDIVIIEDDKEYKSVTIKIKYRGVCLREIKKGNQIGTKRQYKIEKGQFILSRIDARQGAFGIVPDDLEGAVVTGDFWTFEINKKLLNIELFNYLLKSPIFLDACIRASKGTTNRKRIQEEFFLNYEINIPDIKKQEEIVKRLNSHQEKYKIIKSEIFNQDKMSNQLRQSILKKAVQGKLAPQDSNDETASELMKKIRAEKEELIKDRIRGKGKTLELIMQADIPYELPAGWNWIRLTECCRIQTGKLDANEMDNNGQYPFFTCGREVFKTKDYKFDTEAVILGGNNAGGNFVMHYYKGKFNAYQRTYVITTYANISIKYTYIVIQTMLKQLRRSSLGTLTKFITMKHFENALFPLPPLNEQKRIVEKVDKLMRLCDELELNVKESQKNADLLMQSVLQEAFNINQKTN